MSIDSQISSVYNFRNCQWHSCQLSIISGKLPRNLIHEVWRLDLVTVLLLRDLSLSFWIVCCALFTLIDLLGSMYYGGLTIEISSSIMILCAGTICWLCSTCGIRIYRVHRHQRWPTRLLFIDYTAPHSMVNKLTHFPFFQGDQFLLLD